MPNINVGEITEALNDKMDRDAHNIENPSAVVIETYSNGTNWYRVWSDNWCEQGGLVNPNTTVNFLKPFVDTNYTLTAVIINESSSSSMVWNQVAFNNRTTTSFTLGPNGAKQNWKAEGYIS